MYSKKIFVYHCTSNSLFNELLYLVRIILQNRLYFRNQSNQGHNFGFLPPKHQTHFMATNATKMHTQYTVSKNLANSDFIATCWDKMRHKFLYCVVWIFITWKSHRETVLCEPLDLILPVVTGVILPCGKIALCEPALNSCFRYWT